MQKITILALHLGYGGVEKSISSLSNILVKKYDVEIISVYKIYDEPAFHINDKVKITYLLDKSLSPNKEEFKDALKSKQFIRVIKEGLKSLKILRLKKSKMVESIKNIKSGIVISTRIEHNKLLSKYVNEGITTIAQEHTHHNDNMKYINSLVNSCKNIDYFMPVSFKLTKFYREYFEETKTKCEFIPHSLDYIPENVSNLENKNIISVGRLSPEKGFYDLIDVFNLVIKKRPDWKLNIVGDGTERDKMLEKINNYGIQEKVILHGYRDKEYINELLEKSSIYAMASYEESFGIVLIEAQSFGIPCIAFDSAQGACEIIEDNQNGYLVKNRSKEDMASKIIELIDNKELRDNMGRSSRENAYNYSKERVSDQWFNFINDITNN